MTSWHTASTWVVKPCIPYNSTTYRQTSRTCRNSNSKLDGSTMDRSLQHGPKYYRTTTQKSTQCCTMLNASLFFGKPSSKYGQSGISTSTQAHMNKKTDVFLKQLYN